MELPSTFVEGFHDENEIKKLKYTRLGKTELKLSNLGIGGGTFGDFYGASWNNNKYREDLPLLWRRLKKKICRLISTAFSPKVLLGYVKKTFDENEGISLVREGIKCGANYIDTSPYYGHTYSEKLCGKALVGIPRQAYIISTKVGRYGTSWADYFDHSAERIIQEFDKSLNRLGLEYVDIVFVHDIEFSPLQQILTESLPAVQSLVEKKKARYIGISGYPVSVLWEAVEKSAVNIDVVLSYARDCLFDASLKKYSSFFQAHDVGLINAALTAMGLLTNDGPQQWHPASDMIKELCHNASLYCKEQGVEFGKLAVYYAMQQPYYSSHLVGMKTLRELHSNLEVATKGLTEQELKALEYIKLKFFNSTENYHWEGVELEQYRKYKESNKVKV